MAAESADDVRLSGQAQSKMIALASRGLGQMPSADVPPALRIAAGFTPAKRVKLAGPKIALAVDTDADFRRHLATQVRALVPRIVHQLEAQEPPSDNDLSEAAAVAYLIRQQGWKDVVAAESALAATRPTSRSSAADVARLTTSLATARADADKVRTKLRAQLDQLKADNSQLRRTLGESRSKLKTVESAKEAAERGHDEKASDAQLQARALQADVRRLSAKVAELEAGAVAARRSRRDERDTNTMRLRLLLDTLTQAAAGVQRELALPPSDQRLPADTVPGVRPAGDAQLGRAGQQLADDDPGLLRRLLELPKVHLIIDGYNVSKTAWPGAPLAQQRDRLARGVAALTGGKVIEATIVFDGADLAAAPPVSAPRRMRVIFSPAGVTADDVISDLVGAEPAGRPVVVVSSDGEVAHDAASRGARSVSSLALVRALS